LIPNPSVRLVDASGLPTPALLGTIRGLSAGDAVVDDSGRATPLFRRTLQGVATKPLPNDGVQLTNIDGTPTRAMTALLMGLQP
jgi:hypothetical protein